MQSITYSKYLIKYFEFKNTRPPRITSYKVYQDHNGCREVKTQPKATCRQGGDHVQIEESWQSADRGDEETKRQGRKWSHSEPEVSRWDRTSSEHRGEDCPSCHVLRTVLTSKMKNR